VSDLIHVLIEIIEWQTIISLSDRVVKTESIITLGKIWPDIFTGEENSCAVIAKYIFYQNMNKSGNPGASTTPGDSNVTAIYKAGWQQYPWHCCHARNL